MKVNKVPLSLCVLTLVILGLCLRVAAVVPQPPLSGPAPTLSVVINPTSAVGGARVTGTATLSFGLAAEAGEDSQEISLASSDAAVTVPKSLTLRKRDARTYVGAFEITVLPVKAATAATITAGYGITSKTASLMINPPTVTAIELNLAGARRGSVPGSVRLSGASPAGGFRVPLVSSNPAVVEAPDTITVREGQPTASFQVTTKPVAAETTVTVSVGGAAGGTVSAQLTLTPPKLSALSLSAANVIGGAPVTGTLTIDGPAPAEGFAVPVASSSPGAAAVPATVNVPSGQQLTTFQVSTSAVLAESPVTITAGLGADARTAALAVAPLGISSLAFSPASVKGASQTTGTVTLNGSAASPVNINLSSDDSWAVPVPQIVTIPSGQVSTTFQVNPRGRAAATDVEIKATLVGSQKATTLSLIPPGVASLDLPTLSNPPSIVGGGGDQALGTVVLDVPAPSSTGMYSPFSLALSSSNPTATPVSDRVRFPSNATRSVVVVVSNPPPVQADVPVTITIGEGADARTINLTIKPLGVKTFGVGSSNIWHTTRTLKGNPQLGFSAQVLLSAHAPAGGLTVPLSSNNPAVTLPASVTVPAGQNMERFNIFTKGVTELTTVTLTAGQGSSSATATITLEPPMIQDFKLNTFNNTGTDVSQKGGMDVTGYVTLDGHAPPGGLTLPLSSSDLAASVPTSVTIREGSTGGTIDGKFTINTMTVGSDTTVTLTAGQGAGAKTTTLTVKALGVELLTGSTTAVGGSTHDLTIRLNGAATAGFTLAAASSNPAVASVPATATFFQSSMQGTLTIPTTAVEQDTPVTITVGQGAGAKSFNLIVQPLKVTTVNLNPQSVTGGSPIGGELFLNGSAPAGGFIIPLSSSVAAATVPQTVTVPAGQMRVTFQINTTAVDADAAGTITIGQGPTAVTKNIVVRKP